MNYPLLGETLRQQYQKLLPTFPPLPAGLLVGVLYSAYLLTTQPPLLRESVVLLTPGLRSNGSAQITGAAQWRHRTNPRVYGI